MPKSEVALNKTQFKEFNQDDQFAIFDIEGFGAFEDFDEEVDKLFLKYKTIIVTSSECIYGESEKGVRTVLHPEAFDSYTIALEVLEDF